MPMKNLSLFNPWYCEGVLIPSIYKRKKNGVKIYILAEPNGTVSCVVNREIWCKGSLRKSCYAHDERSRE